MKIRELILSAAALIAVCVPSAFAQQSSTDSTPATTDKPESIAQRKDNQQDRIAQGIGSGQLTAGETKNLETKEADVNKEEHTMRSEDDGHLTAADRAKLNNQQNHLSNQIYQDKHNANTAHYGSGEIGQRRENQQDRIAQGVKSGQLTAGETAKLENQQQGINREVSADRQANGGHLTGADRKAINQSQNRASRNIYNKKHNAAHTRP
jgi:methionine-rich copper-binding protein CopC